MWEAEGIMKEEEVCFQVALCDTWVEIPSSEHRGSEKQEKVKTKMDRFKAVVALDKGYVFSVVAPNYKLITNEDAIRMGQECFDAVFPLLSGEGMKLYNVIMPKSRSFCHLDYIHPGSSFDYSAGDPWAPYLRITNSYNRTFALNYDLGFCRGICRNGIIFGKRNIIFKFYHSKTAKAPQPQFQLRAGELRELQKQFMESLHNLSRYYVNKEYMWALACKVFKIPVPTPFTKDKQREIWEARKAHVEELVRKYFDDKKIGPNGYAALNVLTDFATRPVGAISSEIRINSLQQKAGDWVHEFIEAIQSKTFSFEKYLEEYAKLVA